MQGQTVEWLLDTGAECTLVGADVSGVGQLPPCASQQQPVTIDGKPLNCQGRVLADICIGSAVLPQHPVFVVPAMNTQCLLGTDGNVKVG